MHKVGAILPGKSGKKGSGWSSRYYSVKCDQNGAHQMGLEPTTLALGGLRAIHCATGACGGDIIRSPRLTWGSTKTTGLF